MENFREMSVKIKTQKIKLNDEHNQSTPDKLGESSESDELHCGNLFEFKRNSKLPCSDGDRR